MTSLLDALGQLDDIQPDPFDELFAIASDIGKRATPERVSLRELNSDPSYQRPIDHTKVAEMRAAKAYTAPISVNRREDGSLWITDGQHRAEAARRDGRSHIMARVTEAPSQREQEQANLLTKEADAARIPAGDPRRGRIHPGEWTADEARAMAASQRAKRLKEEKDPEKLEEAAQQATSHVERAVIRHRQAQLRDTISVPGRLDADTLARTQADLAFSKKALTAAGRREFRKEKEPVERQRAEQRYASSYAVGEALEAEARASAPYKRAQAKYDKFYADYRDLDDSLYVARQAAWGAVSPGAVKNAEAAYAAIKKKHDKAYQLANAANMARNEILYQARTEKRMEAAKKRLLAARRTEINDEIATRLNALEGEHVDRHQEQVRKFSDALAAHKRSFSAARKAASAIRRTSPKFEAQNLAKLDAEVKGKLGQTRAIFLDDSVFDDDVAYVDHLKARVWREKPVTEFIGNYPSMREAIPDAVTPDGSERASIADTAHTMIRDKPDAQYTPADVVKLITGIKYGAYADEGQGKTLLAAQARACVAAWEKLGMFRTQRKGGWTDASAPRFRVVGEVRREKEQAVIDAMRAAGAKITDNEVELPEYQSWYKAQAGKRYTLNLGGGRYVHYVPHGAIQTDVKDYTHTVTLDPVRVHAQGQAQVNKFLEERTQLRSNLYMVKHVYANGGEYGRGIYRKENLGPNANRKAAPGSAYAIKAVPATEEDLRWGGWRKRGRGWVQEGTLGQAHEALAAIEKLSARKKPMVWREYGGKEITPQSVFAKKLKTIPGLNASDKRQLERMLDIIGPTLGYSKERKERVQKTPHEAPFSERGVLRMENMGAAEGVKALRKLGLAKGPVSSVPYNVIYNGEHRLGRVAPRLDAYANGSKHFELPEGWGVVHGMTGVRNNADAIERFKSIIARGGLKSIAERRRMGIHGVVTMSQLGDIGSGIDTGVPTTLGVPSYGGYVMFQAKPEAMERRDVFFAPSDYGGGKNRWASYTKYAHSIGQKAIYEPPSHETRTRHLANIASHPGSSNEAIFRHELGWNDIDTIHVDEGIHPQIAKLVAEAKRKGQMPEHVRIAKVESRGFARSVQERARAIRRGE